MITIKEKETCSWDFRESRYENYCVEDFVKKEVLGSKGYAGKPTERLEDQPTKVLSVVANLLEKLLEKNIITFDEFHEIIETHDPGRCELIEDGKSI